MASSRYLSSSWRCIQAFASQPSVNFMLSTAKKFPSYSQLASSLPTGLSVSSSALLLRSQGSLLPTSVAGLISLTKSSPPLSSAPSQCFSTSSLCATSASPPSGSGAGSASAQGEAGSGSDSGEDGGDDSLPHLTRGVQLAEVHLERAAKRVMEDPLSMLMASRGMPLGMSMGNRGTPIDDNAQELPSYLSPKTEPSYQMEAIDELFSTSTGGQGGPDGEVGGQDGNAVHAKVDSWGTTRAGPEEIAKRLAMSNRELEKMAAEADAELGGRDEGSLEADFAKEAPGEAKYRTLEQMSKDIKGLDEVFEVLASVPWLDDNQLQQKELKGVAVVGLLGTLEEVGFKIQEQVHRIWAGERDHSLITECNEAKDQAALISILFHVKKLEEEFGSPSPYQPAGTLL
ncbi:hypothetical protein CEUSTIGMA_g4963.t1 [Chlamydomonas eustigma]|uniref:Uncharacterized protein n=1 Tax=Chlamydomonas eustigma TaxID=1157962 RepID=A0A250X3M4_9CHLO|nr:hypothetical protein CEUSTIGMA_g4963.t1 [Chlamydomonas eustigma]|eukprot:GAX77519.1 hypothetical protein CEUSTIGMA_g4963.t1 [Chlamydomonas eustigma]